MKTRWKIDRNIGRREKDVSEKVREEDREKEERAYLVKIRAKMALFVCLQLLVRAINGTDNALSKRLFQLKEIATFSSFCAIFDDDDCMCVYSNRSSALCVLILCLCVCVCDCIFYRISIEIFRWLTQLESAEIEIDWLLVASHFAFHFIKLSPVVNW